MMKEPDIVVGDIKAGIIDLTARHHRRYPMMQIEDVYQLVYQSVMGPGHLLYNEKRAFDSLKKELANPRSKEKDLFVDISLTIKVVRINLNIFAEQGGSARKLFSAMQKTAQAIPPDKEKLRKIWDITGELAEDGKLAMLDYKGWRLFTDKLQRNSFPTIEHSSAYRKFYMPSYRVILYDLLEYIF